MRILSGVQSSGRLHLGNYYGAIREFVNLQSQGEALYFIANLHALNTVRDGARARELTLETAAAYIALGVDPSKAAVFRQSDIPEVTELYWILGTVAPIAAFEGSTPSAMYAAAVSRVSSRALAPSRTVLSACRLAMK